MMRKYSLTLSVAALALVGASAAYADHHRTGKHGPDADGDGVVTQAEAAIHADRMWQTLDADGDGVLTEADRAAHKAQRAEKRGKRRAEKFAEMDTNNDGELSQAEMQAHHTERMEKRADRHAEHFAKLDSDNSGGLSQSELKAGHDMRRGHHGKRSGHHGKRGGIRMMIKMADADNNGAITRAEFDAARAKHFAMVDSNGDGQISEAEHKAAREAMRAKWQERRAAKQAD